MKRINQKEKNIKEYGHLILEKDGVFFVKPISDKNVLKVLCPYCSEIHQHGKVYGHRAAHCSSFSKNNGYVIVPDFEKRTLEKYNPGIL